jgi:tetratricopeptide (TPR) repeat protein
LDEASARYEQAIALNPDYAEAHSNLANVLQDQGRLDEAIACYQKALKLKPDYAEAHSNIGVTLQQLGRLDEAIAHYEKVLELKPDHTKALFSLTSISPRREYIPESKKLLLTNTLSDLDAMYCHFALGNMYKNIGMASKTFKHYDIGNTLKRKSITYNPQSHSAYVDRLIQVYSKSYFLEKHLSGSKSELPVFIVGMPRSGTTLIEQIISSHSQVYGAGELSLFQYIENTITKEFLSSSPYPECMSLCDKID